MNKTRFSIEILVICPFNVTQEINMTPDLRYPPRFCVLDKEKQIVVDIKNKLSYSYIDANRRLFTGSDVEKIKDSKRVAIRALSSLTYEKYPFLEAKRIIKKLEDGFSYPDGNEMLNNKEYLQLIESENRKLRKVTKRRK